MKITLLFYICNFTEDKKNKYISIQFIVSVSLSLILWRVEFTQYVNTLYNIIL